MMTMRAGTVHVERLRSELCELDRKSGTRRKRTRAQGRSTVLTWKALSERPELMAG